MKTSRIKINLPTITTREEAEGVMNDLALVMCQQRRLLAKRDTEVLAINQRYEGNNAVYDQAIKEKTDTLRAWAESNAHLFKARKSIQFLSGILGFRTGTPKLALLSRAWNWEKVLARLTAFLPRFVRNKPEIDKEAILAERATVDLSCMGLRVVHDESFYVDPNLADLETRQTSEAA